MSVKITPNKGLVFTSIPADADKVELTDLEKKLTGPKMEELKEKKLTEARQKYVKDGGVLTIEAVGKNVDYRVGNSILMNDMARPVLITVEGKEYLVYRELDIACSLS